MNRPSTYKPKAENVKKLEAFLSEMKKNVKDKDLASIINEVQK